MQQVFARCAPGADATARGANRAIFRKSKDHCHCRPRSIRPAFDSRLADAVAKASRRPILRNGGTAFPYQYLANSNIPHKLPLLSKPTATANLSRGLDMRHIQPAKPTPAVGRKRAQKVRETVTLRHLASV